MTQRVSIIIPTLNEADAVGETLRALRASAGPDDEIIVADGGSDDRTAEIARDGGAKIVSTQKGRGIQMDAGARAANGDVFWFVHADTIPAADAIRQLIGAVEDRTVAGGNFTIVFDGASRPARFMTWLYPRLMRIGLAYGDSSIFIRRDVFERIGGFGPVALFEDVDLIRRLKREGRFANLSATVTTSSRRFEGKNFATTFGLWSFLQILYWAGVDPDSLSEIYGRSRPPKRSV
ncbi:MAG: TIGR04283 family arsenosugar biosynthesis glycosyltransferase [Pyrinomonadaceae bacterium]